MKQTNPVSIADLRKEIFRLSKAGKLDEAFRLKRQLDSFIRVPKCTDPTYFQKRKGRNNK